MHVKHHELLIKTSILKGWHCVTQQHRTYLIKENWITSFVLHCMGTSDTLFSHRLVVQVPVNMVRSHCITNIVLQHSYNSNRDAYIIMIYIFFVHTCSIIIIIIIIIKLCSSIIISAASVHICHVQLGAPETCSLQLIHHYCYCKLMPLTEEHLIFVIRSP